MIIPALSLLAVWAHAAQVNVTPSQNWCSIANAATPGTTLVLAAGTYGPCALSTSGTTVAPIVIQSASSSLSQRAIIANTNPNTNIIDLYASSIIFRWLTIGASPDGSDGIRIHNGNNILIEENLFDNVGGVGVPANDVDVAGITIRANEFRNNNSTVIYLGCHSGSGCHASQVLIERNLIVGALPGDGVGSGVQIKLNSSAVVRDNSIYGTRGAGIMVYGSNRGDPANVVEGNYVEGSIDDAGINVGDGPALVRNNVLVKNLYYGIWSQGYWGASLQKSISIVNNTLIGNQSGDARLDGWAAGAGNIFAYNAIASITGYAINGGYPSSAIVGNVSCPSTTCFNQSASSPYDLWPKVGGPLIGTAGSGSESWRPTDDFMGIARGTAADVGTFQRNGAGAGPLLGGNTLRPPRQTGAIDWMPPAPPKGFVLK